MVIHAAKSLVRAMVMHAVKNPAESKQTFGAEQKEPTTGEKSCFVFYLAQPWLGASARLIAGGVAQLQAAMLKQMAADNNGKGLQRP